mgnify:CR=1 FL=1
MLKGAFNEFFSEVVVVDCRYPYEFEGGHINGARNLHTPQQIEATFPVIRCAQEDDKQRKPAIIFYCEFSSGRGPRQYVALSPPPSPPLLTEFQQRYRHLRKLDREANYDLYPQLYYPHLFLLGGGYKEFFLSMKVVAYHLCLRELTSMTKGEMCYPNTYVEMRDTRFLEELKRHTRRSMKNEVDGSKSYSRVASAFNTGGN